MPAVFVERGGADAVQLAAGEHGLEHVAGVDGALGLARADDIVQFVDEKEDAAVALPDFVEHGLQAFLELAAVFGAGQQRAHVEGEDGFVLEPLGHVAAQDALRQALDNGGLAHARLPDEHGVVLGLARQDADGAADLVVAADDGVELALSRLLHEVDAVFLQRLVGALGIVGRHALVAADFGECLQHLGAVKAEAFEILFQPLGLGHVDEAKQQVLGADVLVLELRRRLLGAREHLVDGLGDVDLGHIDAAGDLGQAVELALDRELQSAHGQAEFLDQRRHDAALLPKQRREQVPGIHLVVGTTAGLVLRLGDDLARHDGEPVGIHGFIPRMPRAKLPPRKISRAGVSTAGHVGRRRDAPAQAGLITGRLLSRHDDPKRRPPRTVPGS